MSTKTTYVLFGKTNPYLAKFGPFNGRTLVAMSAEYGTRDEASTKLMVYCSEESDNYNFSDDGKAVQCLISFNKDTEEATYENVMVQGDLSYEHDGRSWYFVALNELAEDEANAVLRANILSNNELEVLYAEWPELRPVQEDEEEDTTA